MYKELVKLHPGSKKYQNKVLFYSRKIKEKQLAKSHRSQPPKTEQKSSNYKVLNYELRKIYVEPYQFENINILLILTDLTKETVEKSARDIRKKECKVKCNILFWDAEKAYVLNMQKGPGELVGKDYIFVADHLLGQFLFGGGEFTYYPFKDWFYKETKTKLGTL